MRKSRMIPPLAALALAAYLTFWPVPVDPVAWTPAVAPPPAGVLAPNTALAPLERIAVPGIGPEDVAVDTAGRLYAGLADGRIVRLAPDGGDAEPFVDTGGRPLGLDFGADGTLYVADARRGLLAVAPGGGLTVLATAAAGIPFGFTDDVDVAADGTVFFSDASHRFGIDDYVLDLIENRPSGRLLAYDPATKTTRVLLDDLHFANGVAVSPNQEYVLVNETARYRVRRYWLAGPRAGTSDVFADNLPAFNDGISTDPAGGYWVALVSPRNAMVDRMGPWPALRKVLVRLPAVLRPKPERVAHVVYLDGDGRLVRSLQDPEGTRLATISSVERYGDALYFGSLEAPALGRLPWPR